MREDTLGSLTYFYFAPVSSIFFTTGWDFMAENAPLNIITDSYHRYWK